MTDLARLRLALFLGRFWGCFTLLVAVTSLFAGWPLGVSMCWLSCTFLSASATANLKRLYRNERSDQEAERAFHEQMAALKRQVEWMMVERGYWPVKDEGDHDH